MNIWNGIYSDFTNDSRSANGFTHPKWVEKSIERLAILQRGDVHSRKQVATIDPGTLAIAMVCATLMRKQPLILDIGGNLGQTAIMLSTDLKYRDVRWVVIERADFLQECSKFLLLPSKVEFRNSISEVDGDADVVHFGSSLQYFEDWKGSLGEAASSGADWIVISDLPGSHDISTFASRQKYYDDYLECWFFAIQDLVGHLNNLGYELVLETPFVTEMTQKYFPEASFPETHQINYPVDLLFRKIL